MSSNARDHSWASAGQAQMLTQTAAQGMPGTGGSHLAKQMRQEIRAPTHCIGKPNAGRSWHVNCFQLGIFPTKSGPCAARKAEICHDHHFRSSWKKGERPHTQKLQLSYLDYWRTVSRNLCIGWGWESSLPQSERQGDLRKDQKNGHSEFQSESSMPMNKMEKNNNNLLVSCLSRSWGKQTKTKRSDVEGETLNL